MIYPKLVTTGCYLPNRCLTNDAIAKQVDTSDAWITERTGIRQRYIAAATDTSASMGEAAARQALQSAELPATEIDLILVATCTPDQVFPSTACHIQQRLEVGDCIAFDVSAACAGFIYALSIAEKFISSGSVKRALVIGTEVMSRVLDWSDRSTCILFGDGAGAFLLEAVATPGLQATVLHADGQHKDLLYVPNRMAGSVLTNDAYLCMQGREIFRLAVKMMADAAAEVLAKANVAIDTVDWIIPHQANLRIIQAVAKQLNLPLEKVVVTVDQHANTSSASIPLALHHAITNERIKRGDSIVLQGFGGGLAWGAGLLTY